MIYTYKTKGITLYINFDNVAVITPISKLSFDIYFNGFKERHPYPGSRYGDGKPQDQDQLNYWNESHTALIEAWKKHKEGG